MLVQRNKGRQKGQGIGGIFRGIVSFVKPIFKKLFGIGRKVVKNPIVRDTIQDTKDAAIEVGVNTLSDVLKGENLKESVLKRANEAKGEVADKFINRVGQGLKKAGKRGSTNQKKTKKKKNKKARDRV